MIAVPSSVLNRLEQYDMATIWNAAHKLGLPTALWKLPQGQSITLLISLKGDLSHVEADLEKLPAGFIMAPFAWDNQQLAPFIEGDVLIDYSLTGKNLGVTYNNGASNNPVLQQLQESADSEGSHSKNDNNSESHFQLHEHCQETERKKFIDSVKRAVKEIGDNKFQKVVLSRAKSFQVDENFEVIKAYQKLIDQYAHAFVSLVNLPAQQEIWMGASPELLVSVSSSGNFCTMSLAGTQPAFDQDGKLIPKIEIRWGQKEIEEQALVSRYIVECFKKIRLREYLETGPKTQQAGNLYHLQTDFQVNTQDVHFEELGTVMLKLLHPTSAICGTPKETAKAFIDDHEGYDRSFYSGFLGPVQIAGSSQLFVNLRSLRLKNQQATFYAGAGITEDSNATKEWEETEMKCDTLLKVIAAKASEK